MVQVELLIGQMIWNSAGEDGTNYAVLAEGAVTADTTASVYTHVFDGDKPTSIVFRVM